MQKTSTRLRRSIGLYLWHPEDASPKLVEGADDLEEAAAIAAAFNMAEQENPTGGRLFIEVHQKCTKAFKIG